jgi:hypothetical protein
MKQLFSILIFQFVLLSSFGQNIELSGIITDSINNPIQYASVGVLNKPIGTVSNTEGAFNLILSSDNKNDTLRISSLGFKSQDYLIIDLKNKKAPISIKLQKYVESLDEVVISSKKLKTYTEGKTKTKTKQKVIFANPDLTNINLGSEIGRKFKLGDNDPSHLTKFKFYIKDNNFDSVKFRINIYTIENNRPAKKINTQNIITSARKDYVGWIEVDLSPFDIIVKEDIVVAVEWIGHSEKGNELNLPIIIPSFGSTHFYKFGSQNAWEKYGSISSAMELTYEQ